MSGRKKVGIVTMHKVKNYGSALQAYALQKAVEKSGGDSFIIDYQYPNGFHRQHLKNKSLFKKNLLRGILGKLKMKLFYRSQAQHALFASFWNKEFNQTQTYRSLEELRANAPRADILMTGSDQVWNPGTMFGDPAFLCGFGEENIRRVSFGASFAGADIPEHLKENYKRHLSRYAAISVREHSSADMVTDLTGREVTVVCDPTLLLTQNDYRSLASQSALSVKQPYLLAYILDYAYTPYPAIKKLIREISKERKLNVVYLLCGNANGIRPGSTVISAAGPNEFLRLFQEASFVVTSSFHGTMFSMIYEKSFYAVVPPDRKGDCRIASLLNQAGLEDRAVAANEHWAKNSRNESIDYGHCRAKIDTIRTNGLKYIKKILDE